ncbi:MAG TPA: class A beta-lactamase [Pseudonocardiaceae bacterium]|nr:class A beta-lactamase [Pseudonocardiaceae bacterium]
MIHRRTLLLGALALPLAACATRTAAASPPPPPTTTTSPPPTSVDTAPRFVALERKYRTRLGLYAVATSTGATLAYRADERFAFCSTFKGLVAAAVLNGHPLSYLDTKVAITRSDVDSISPVTEQHIGSTMTIRQLCDAAVRYSDGTAGNLLMRAIGGPAALTSYLRGLGDQVSRMDQYEPQLNRNSPHDPRDTTTPRALAGDYRQLVLGTALPAAARSLLTTWLRTSTTGAQDVRAGVPKDWTVADKTGHGDYGRANDVAIAWPPGAPPLVIAIMSDREGYHADATYAIIAEAAAYAATTVMS